MEEAIEWAKKCPNPMEDEDSDIEIRTFYTMEDFAEADLDSNSRCTRRRTASNHRDAKSGSTKIIYFSRDEALAFYKEHLSADVKFMIRFNESPEPMPEGVLQPGFENKVMHAEFSLGNVRVMASDGCNDVEKFSGFRIALSVPAEEETRRIFNALASEGGKVDMPLMKTFWSPLYGQVTDKFGVGLDGRVIPCEEAPQ